MRGRGVLCAVALAMMSTGCSSFSGLDAKSSFACPVTGGVSCLSVTDVYGESLRNALPAQQSGARAPSQASPAQPAQATGAPRPVASAHRGTPPSTGVPLRSSPRILRIWIAPYEDSDGDLRDQSYIYVTVDPGGWEIAHTRRAIRDRFMAIRVLEPPPAAGAPSRGIDPAAPAASTSERGAAGFASGMAPQEAR